MEIIGAEHDVALGASPGAEVTPGVSRDVGKELGSETGDAPSDSFEPSQWQPHHAKY